MGLPGGHQGSAMVPPSDRQGAAMWPAPSNDRGGTATGPRSMSGRDASVVGPPSGQNGSAMGPSGGRAVAGPPADAGSLDLDLAHIDYKIIPINKCNEITKILDGIGKILHTFRRSNDGGATVAKAIELATYITDEERRGERIYPDTAAHIEPLVLSLGTARSIRRSQAKRELRKLRACHKGADLIVRLREELGGL